MPKSNSQPETIISTRPHKLSKKLSWIQQRTRQALEYYKTKKEDLKSAKSKYLKKIGELDPHKFLPSKRRPSQAEDSSPQLRRLAPQRNRIYKEQSQSEQAVAAYMAEEVQAASAESSLSSEERYELRGVHQATLEVQRIIDTCLEFHFLHRQRRSMSRAEVINYLKTTKYCLNCERYIDLLQAYNRNAYQWNEGRIACRQFSEKQMNERVEATRSRMKRKRVEEADLLL